MSNTEEIFNKAKKLHQSGKIKEAQKLYKKIINIDKNNFQLFFLLGSSYLQTTNYLEAINYLDTAIRLNTNYANAYNNRGIALAEIKNYSDAIKDYDLALKLNKDFFNAYLNKGVALKNLKEFKKAIETFKFSIKLNPNNSEVYNNLGNVYKELFLYDKANSCYRQAIKLNKNYAGAYNNLGIVLQAQLKFKEAEINYSKAFSLDKNIENLLGNRIHNKQFQCNWENYDEELVEIKKSIIEKKNLIYPFIFLTISDDLKLHKVNTEKLINTKFSVQSEVFKKSNLKKNNKIKIAYFSAEFHQHAVLFLMMDVFKNHDKSNFEILAFSHGPLNKEKDPWRKIVKPYFDNFYDIKEKSAKEVVKLCRELKIDIAINLTGLTENHRTDIFINRVAPIQINYLGYPGTLGSNCMDYILADKNIIPEDLKKNYSEKVLYLPNCYQPNPKDLFINKNNNRTFHKIDFGLPEKNIIYCSFNSNHKITPFIFNVWMKILKKVNKSVLWIYANNDLARKNLKIEAKKRGVDSDRIIFAGQVPILDHIERIKLADIFLDTFPYNAHTSASDCIRVGLPLITLMGKSFASRVASSLLSSINMHELITTQIDDYEKLAIKLGNNKKELKKIKEKIRTNLKNSSLYNSERFTRDLENIYKKIVDKNL